MIGRCPPAVTAPTRLPPRDARSAKAPAAAKASSALSCSAVPKARLADMSTTIHVSSSWSAIVSRTWCRRCGR